MRETLIAIMADMGFDEARIRKDGVGAGIKFEARLCAMVQMAIRKFPDTMALAYDHVARRFVPDEWD